MNKMSVEHLHSSLRGLPLRPSSKQRSVRKSALLVKGKPVFRVSFDFLLPGRSWKWYGEASFSHVRGEGVRLSPRNSDFRSRFRVCCTKESFPKTKALIRSIAPCWKEGLLFFRCSIFVAVISAIGMLVWYGQVKARSFVEARLLPSVCSILGDYLQRELDVGKVQSISPLGITLQSCSIGPHREEFSCGEVSTMKLRIRPFASLRRGKLVIDAVLSQPSILVAQKEDFSWLGIPPASESGLLRHLSTEEGIDYRTKVRRIAREESAAQWSRERVEAAKQAAELGYVLPQDNSKSSLDDDLKDDSTRSSENGRSGLFYCMDEKMHLKDDHCVDNGIEYGLKHADLEKSFGAKVPRQGQKLWSKLIPYSLRRKFKRDARRKLLLESSSTTGQRNLMRSAAAALAYFQGVDSGGYFTESFPKQGRESSNGDSADSGVEGVTSNGGLSSSKGDTTGSRNDQIKSSYLSNLCLVNGGESVNLPPEASDGHSVNKGMLDLPSDIKLVNDGNIKSRHLTEFNHCKGHSDDVSLICHPFLMVLEKFKSNRNKLSRTNANNTSDFGNESTVMCSPSNEYVKHRSADDRDQEVDKLQVPLLNQGLNFRRFGTCAQMHQTRPFWPLHLKPWSYKFPFIVKELFSDYFGSQFQNHKSGFSLKSEDFDAELAMEANENHMEGIQKVLPITLDSVYFTGGTLMLLGFGDQEPRQMVKVDGCVRFQNQYNRIHVQLNGDCMEWKSDRTPQSGGQLSIDVFVDILEQKWHANLKIANLFAPLFERILEIPITWFKGRASGEVHICMSKMDNFPNLHGQLDVNGLSFQILDAPSHFSEVTASLCFRGQRVFLHNTSGWFGDAPLEASGDFGINPDDGEFHLMCQVPCVEVNALMKTLKMKPLMFPLAGSITAVFNCQGPLDAPSFVGSGIISRKTSHLISTWPLSCASEAVFKDKEAGAVAAFDRIPFSHVSANFTFNLDNCVADLYGIRASLLDGGEIRGAGNAWICPEGEMDDTAVDVNLSGKFIFDNVLHRYLPQGVQLVPLKIGEINGETKLSGSLFRPRFDIKWTAPKAEDSFSDARGDIIISHDNVSITSSSIAFDLCTKVQTSYPDDYWLQKQNPDLRRIMPFTVEGIDLDLRLRGFEFANFISSIPFDTPRPLHLKATGRIKFQGKVVKPVTKNDDKIYLFEKDTRDVRINDMDRECLVGDLSLTGIKLNQLLLAPQLAGSLCISQDAIKLDATGRPDESVLIEVTGPFIEGTLNNKRLLSISLQKGQLRANICYQPQYSANVEVRNLPLDELELASLRGTIQRAELLLNFQKRRGHGLLSVLHPKFSGVLGEALDVAARWSGDVITVEKTVLEQANSRYELQGEYVLPGMRDRHPVNKKDGFFEKAMAGHLNSVISSMGRWRMRLEVPGAEVAEMLPLARLLSRSTDPAVRSRSKDLFIHTLQSVGFYAESLHDQLEAIQSHYNWSDENILEDFTLPGLAEFKGRWHGSLDASGGSNGDTRADFDFHGEDWEWGSYKTQRILAIGVYSNNNGLRLENLFIQKDNATLHADGTFLGPVTNLHFAVLNFPVGLVPTLVQILESSATDSLHSLRQFFTPIKGILHMEGDLRGTLAKPECDVQIRLLDGAIGGIDLGRAEVVASVTAASRFLFNANFEPIIQSGHVHIQGSVPVTYSEIDSVEETDKDGLGGAIRIPVWLKENERRSADDVNEKKVIRDKTEEGWDFQLSESLKGLNWNLLDAGEVRINADIKDGGMMLITALSPYANWLQGHADIDLQVRGTVEQPVIDGSASFHRATISSPVLRKPLTNFGGTVLVKSNRLCISSMESKVNRKGKLLVKGSLPLRSSESSDSDKIELKCEVLEVRAKNILSGQVDSQMQIKGSILQPNISGMIKLSHGEAYLPHDKGNGAVINRLSASRPSLPAAGYSRMTTSGHVSRFFGSLSPSQNKWPQPSGTQSEVEKKLEQVNAKQPGIDVQLSDLKLLLGPELRIVYPLILNFAVSGELELNGRAHPKLIKPRGILTFENGDVNLVATQLRLKREHLNVAKFEPDLGLDPILDLALVGSEWQFRIQSRASTWQDNLVVTSTRSVDQDVLSPSEAARVFESQLAESLLEGEGQLAFKKLATATLETLMPRIEGKGEFGQARWRLVYAPQIPSLLSVDPSIDPLKSLANNISFGTEVEVQLGKRLQASVVRQMKDSEMAMQWTLIYQLTSRLRVLFQSAPSNRLLFEYTATSQN